MFKIKKFDVKTRLSKLNFPFDQKFFDYNKLFFKKLQIFSYDKKLKPLIKTFFILKSILKLVIFRTTLTKRFVGNVKK